MPETRPDHIRSRPVSTFGDVFVERQCPERTLIVKKIARRNAHAVGRSDVRDLPRSSCRCSRRVAQAARDAAARRRRRARVPGHVPPHGVLAVRRPETAGRVAVGGRPGGRRSAVCRDGVRAGGDTYQATSDCRAVDDSKTVGGDRHSVLRQPSRLDGAACARPSRHRCRGNADGARPRARRRGTRDRVRRRSSPEAHEHPGTPRVPRSVRGSGPPRRRGASSAARRARPQASVAIDARGADAPLARCEPHHGFSREFPLEWEGRTYFFDFAFERERTILETNGRRWHDDPADYEDDHEKWSVPGRHGYFLVLATWDKVTRRQREFLAELGATLEQRSEYLT